MDPLPPLPSLPAAIPRGFEAVVQRALEKDPAQRYASAVELAQALAPFASTVYRDRAYQLVSLTAGGPADGAHMMPTVSAPRSSPTTLGAAAGQTKEPPIAMRSRRMRVLVGAACVVVAVLAFGLTMLRGSGHPESGEAPAINAPRPVAKPTVPAPTAPTAADPKISAVVASPRAHVTPPIDAGVIADVAPPDAARIKPADNVHRTQPEDPFKSSD
jgi:serine/threonine-protein kinase